MKSFVISRSVCFTPEVVNIISKQMNERQENFSKIVNFLIKQSDYLLNTLNNLREKSDREKEKQLKYYPKEKIEVGKIEK